MNYKTYENGQKSWVNFTEEESDMLVDLTSCVFDDIEEAVSALEDYGFKRQKDKNLFKKKVKPLTCYATIVLSDDLDFSVNIHFQ